MKKGRAGTMTHDYKRNGTTTLFAALNVLDGSVIGQCMQRHRHQEFIRFLNRIERDVPAGKLIHVVLDNYATHKHPKVRAWLERHRRWTFHYTPTSASWLNAVEGFFAKLTRRRLQRGVFHSLVDLQAAINRYLAEHNQSPQAVRLDRRARGDPGQSQTRASNVRDDPLVSRSSPPHSVAPYCVGRAPARAGLPYGMKPSRRCRLRSTAIFLRLRLKRTVIDRRKPIPLRIGTFGRQDPSANGGSIPSLTLRRGHAGQTVVRYAMPT